MTTAVVFPGQGSQRAGMALDFHDADAGARAAFEEASDALSLDVAELCFADADAHLELTEFAQPAIVTVEIAMLRFLATRGFEIIAYGGHSLGEYTALVAAGVLPLADTVRLVRERGRLMQEAVPLGEGGMTAIVGKDLDAAAIAAAAESVGVDVANYNAGDQLVLSGLMADLDAACTKVRALPGHERIRALALRVSVPFHSRHMRPVENALRPLLADRSGDWNVRAADHVTSNCDGGFHRADADAIADALSRQASSPVRWVDNMAVLHASADRIVEIGPGKPLAAFFKKEGVTVTSVTELAGAEALLAG
jgi:[acyl-carrier-protein] S-malonyltransferase/trans-AT polyketide synthase/acyltransferase/oxidoreductase domain-containing protein